MKPRIICIAAMLSLFAAASFGQVPEKEKVLSTAKAEVDNFIRLLPANNLADYGFSDAAELKQFTFADPIPVYTLEDSTIVFTYTWRVPLVINKEWRSLLTVINENGTFKAVDFGACELAKAYAATKTQKTIGMLRVYEIKQDFLMEKTESGKQVLKALEYNR
jgi:hypothetical protein